jgi:hypothetical protein
VNALARIRLGDDELDLLPLRYVAFGGYVTIECQAFFDESASHDGAPILCVAGLIFKKNEAIKLRRKWRKILNWKQLPYFHMVDCAHGNGPFANLTKAERIDVQIRMIEIIKRRAIQGLAVTINNLDFLSVMAEYPVAAKAYRTPYVFCCHTILAGVGNWIGRNPKVSKMAYIFEHGHRSAPQSMKAMDELFAVQEKREQYRAEGVGYAFMRKRESCALQAADLLAWHWYKDKKNQLEGKPRRKDCANLLQMHINTGHLDRNELVSIIKGSPIMSKIMRAGPLRDAALEQFRKLP